MDQLEQLFNTNTPAGLSYDVGTVMLSLLMSVCLTVPIAIIYMKMHKEDGYDQSLVQTFILLSTIISLVMLLIGNNLVSAIGLVGAVSIVRFRTRVKNPRDMAFIFTSIAIGMTCGLQIFSLAIAATVFMCILIFLLWKLDFGKYDFGVK